MSLGHDQWLFLSEFLRHPLQVAAVQPSSRAFVDDLLDDFSFDPDRVYVEYGAGTGVVAKEICRRMSEDSVCVAVEPNRSFGDYLWHENSRIKVIQDRAENATDKILELYGPADLIIAGLPFSMMSEENIHSVIDSAHTLLRGDGELRMFLYAHSLVLPKIQKMMDYSLERFPLTWTNLSWNNIPPMAIIRCLQ